MAEITPTNTYKIIRPTIWQRLGFGTCLAPDVEPVRAKASLSRMSVLPPSSDSVQSEEPPK